MSSEKGKKTYLRLSLRTSTLSLYLQLFFIKRKRLRICFLGRSFSDFVIINFLVSLQCRWEHLDSTWTCCHPARTLCEQLNGFQFRLPSFLTFLFLIGRQILHFSWKSTLQCPMKVLFNNYELMCIPYKPKIPDLKIKANYKLHVHVHKPTVGQPECFKG